MATRPTINRSGNVHDDLSKVLAYKCKIYFAVGMVPADGTSLPTSKTELEELYTGSSAPFVPRAKMDESMGKITWKQGSLAADFHKVPGAYEVTADFNSVTIDDKAVGYFDSVEGKGVQSVLIVPQTQNLNRVIILNSVTAATEGDIGFDGKKLGVIKLSYSASVTQLDDCVKICEIS